MLNRIKAAKQQEEQEATGVPKMMIIDKSTPEGRKMAKLITNMERRKRESWEEKDARLSLENLLRQSIGKYSPNEQKVLGLPLRLAETMREVNSVVMAVGEYEREQKSREATPRGIEMADAVQALLDHINETVKLLWEKYPEMRT